MTLQSILTVASLALLAGFLSGWMLCASILRDKIDAESWCEGYFGKKQWEKMRREKDGTFKKQ